MPSICQGCSFCPALDGLDRIARAPSRHSVRRGVQGFEIRQEILVLDDLVSEPGCLFAFENFHSDDLLFFGRVAVNQPDGVLESFALEPPWQRRPSGRHRRSRRRPRPHRLWALPRTATSSPESGHLKRSPCGGSWKHVEDGPFESFGFVPGDGGQGGLERENNEQGAEDSHAAQVPESCASCWAVRWRTSCRERSCRLAPFLRAVDPRLDSAVDERNTSVGEQDGVLNSFR